MSLSDLLEAVEDQIKAELEFVGIVVAGLHHVFKGQFCEVGKRFGGEVLEEGLGDLSDPLSGRISPGYGRELPYPQLQRGSIRRRCDAGGYCRTLNGRIPAGDRREVDPHDGSS